MQAFGSDHSRSSAYCPVYAHFTYMLRHVVSLRLSIWEIMVGGRCEKKRSCTPKCGLCKLKTPSHVYFLDNINTMSGYHVMYAEFICIICMRLMGKPQVQLISNDVIIRKRNNERRYALRRGISSSLLIRRLTPPKQYFNRIMRSPTTPAHTGLQL